MYNLRFVAYIKIIRGENPKFSPRINTQCDSVGIRTQDPQLRRLLLYPAELRNHRFCGANIVFFSER